MSEDRDNLSSDEKEERDPLLITVIRLVPLLDLVIRLLELLLKILRIINYTHERIDLPQRRTRNARPYALTP